MCITAQKHKGARAMVQGVKGGLSMVNVALAGPVLPSVPVGLSFATSPHKPTDLASCGAAWQVMGITWTHRWYLLFMVGADHLRACGTGHTRTKFAVQRGFICPRRTDRRWGQWREGEKGKEEGEDMFVRRDKGLPLG